MDGPVRPDVPPEDPQRPRVFAPEPITTEHPPILRWVALGAVALVLVIAKPWAASGPAGAVMPSEIGGVGEPVVTTAPPGSPSPPGSPAEPSDPTGRLVAAFCLEPGEWLVATVEGFGERSRRTWRALSTRVSADGPTDPDIPTTTLITEGVRLLGWCAPVVGDERPSGPAALSVWTVDRRGARPIEPPRRQPSGSASAFGAMYGPPPDETTTSDAVTSATAVAWPDGRFVFRHATAGTTTWFAIVLERRPAVVDGP